MSSISMMAVDTVESHILRLLTDDTILSLNEVGTALVQVAELGEVRRALAELRHQNLVTLRARRRGVWYLGYTLGQDRTRRQHEPDEIPQPFRALLSQPAW